MALKLGFSWICIRTPLGHSLGTKISGSTWLHTCEHMRAARSPSASLIEPARTIKSVGTVKIPGVLWAFYSSPINSWMFCRLFGDPRNLVKSLGPPTTDKISAYSDATPAGQWVSPPGQESILRP